jgi:hypothetical protein
MKKWSSELSRDFSSPNGQKTHEEMLTTPGHKRNARQKPH